MILQEYLRYCEAHFFKEQVSGFTQSIEMAEHVYEFVFRGIVERPSWNAVGPRISCKIHHGLAGPAPGNEECWCGSSTPLQVLCQDLWIWPLHRHMA